jgi:CBS domain-containing protein
LPITGFADQEEGGMKIEQLMTKNVGTCLAEDVLSVPARIMWERDCGCVPVVASDGSGRVVGMLTDRDICMAALMQAGKLEDLRVAGAMCTEIRSCKPSSSLREAEQLMCQAQLRRLPVVDEADQLLGLISLADIAAKTVGAPGASKKSIPRREVADTLVAICHPRVKSPPVRSK